MRPKKSKENIEFTNIQKQLLLFKSCIYLCHLQTSWLTELTIINASKDLKIVLSFKRQSIAAASLDKYLWMHWHFTDYLLYVYCTFIYNNTHHLTDDCENSNSAGAVAKKQSLQTTWIDTRCHQITVNKSETLIFKGKAEKKHKFCTC